MFDHNDARGSELFGCPAAAYLQTVGFVRSAIEQFLAGESGAEISAAGRSILGPRHSNANQVFCRIVIDKLGKRDEPVKRKASYIQAIVPALSEWAIEPGDRVRAFSPLGDPRDPNIDLSQAYIVPDPFVLQPSYLTGFLNLEIFSKREIEEFENVIETKLSIFLLSKLHQAMSGLVCTIALNPRLATWRQIEDQLRLILKTCETLTNSAGTLIILTDPNLYDNSVSRGALSPDQLIKKLIWEKLDIVNQPIQPNLDPIIELCNDALQKIILQTKRGRKPEQTLRVFLQRLLSAMKDEGLNVKVPSNENAYDKVDKTFAFVIKLLATCVDKCEIAIIGSSLNEYEQESAIKLLRHCRKSPRALVHYFRDGSLG